jgi:hypothetical protein
VVLLPSPIIGNPKTFEDGRYGMWIGSTSVGALAMPSNDSNSTAEAEIATSVAPMTTKSAHPQLILFKP